MAVQTPRMECMSSSCSCDIRDAASHSITRTDLSADTSDRGATLVCHFLPKTNALPLHPSILKTPVAESRCHIANTSPGSQTQKGIISYAMSPNRQKPLAGAYRNAVFNTARRTSHQILYWLPPMVLGYALMEWAIERCERLWYRESYGRY